MTKKVEVCFLLDETGSMSVIRDVTISSFNEYVDTLKASKDAGAMRFTLTQFNSEKSEVVCDGVKLDGVAGLTKNTYSPTAFTPLYDAIGKTIRAIEKRIEGKKRDVLFIIQTDGEENASREFTRGSIFSLVEEKRNAGWTFVFLGADIDAYTAGAVIGIPRAQTVSYAKGDTSDVLCRVAQASMQYVSNAVAGNDDDVNWQSVK